MVRPVVFPHLMAVMANCSLEVVGGGRWVALEWAALQGKNLMCFLNVMIRLFDFLWTSRSCVRICVDDFTL